MVNRGSEWRRWEPHIHAPGTVLNNQFGGGNAWTNYLTALETATPKIEAIAVTDYYVTDTYEEVLLQRRAGRLPDVQLIFPNIEVRLDVAARSGFVNLHLLVSPEDPDHLVEVRRILTRLQFNAHGDRLDCTREELIRLGKRADPAITDDQSALAHGSTQFKVNFAQLREVFSESDWAKKNILIAVAGGLDDGTSGMRQAADATLRQEIEKFSHVIFASSPAQREFWLGQRSASVDELRTRYNGCKPCLHGSDAHGQSTVGQPTDDRFCWIKGALTFDALRQACIDPGGRAYVGREPPHLAMQSQVISQVKITDASWAVTPTIPLNPGLVAIIGARGSGKTALTDVIAAGCEAIASEAWDADENISPSFLARARTLIGDAKVTLTWGGGTTITRALDGHDANGPLAYPRARYLSQQFVEELCSSKGASEGLIQEIERVIFEAHPEDQLEGATTFVELLECRTMRFRQSRQREVDAIASISERIAEELEKETIVNALNHQTVLKRALIAGYNADLAKLVIKGTQVQAKRHAELSEAAQALNSKMQRFGNQRRTFLTMQDEVSNMRATKAPEMLREVQARYPGSGLDAAQWNQFLLVYKGDVDKALSGYIVWGDQEVEKINGVPPLPGDPNVPLIADGVDLATVKLATIKAEMARLEQFISADTVIRNQYVALSSRIALENNALKALETRLMDAQGAAARRKALQTEREAAYGRVFDAVISEQNELVALYAPLMGRLAKSSGTLQKLSFSVSRVADANTWADFAEDKLIDCRKSGPFYGRGSLTVLANSELKQAWETGSAVEIQTSMAGFIAKYWKDLLKHAPYVPAQTVEFRTWLKQFAQWLFSTDHITVRYETSYDSVDIRKLSPGTRGIVLLLLYLALDDLDDRPLVIDQPEENLDPKSVFDELVSLFITAKAKRQVIIVTHNANLVINTDADQIIIADAGSHPTGGLPPITYVAGGLEDANIRKAVCDILEGGEDAFRERARRLRVRLER
jgi:hypothetical protein